MKKFFMFAAMASVALASCVKNEPVATVEQGDAITFASPVVGVPTKADELTGLNYPINRPFSVYAWYSANDFASTGTMYMRNVEVNFVDVDGNTTLTTDKDYYAPATDYYWPKSGKLSFIAYSPVTLPAADGSLAPKEMTETGEMALDFTVPTAAANQIDLLYSDWALNKTSSEGTAGGYAGVDIAFRHALSVVKFAFKGTNEAAGNIKITNVVLNGVKNKGTLTCTWAATPTAGWDGVAATTPAPVYQVSKDSEYVLTEDPSALGTDVHNLILLPQDLTADAELVISYSLKSPATSEWIPQEAATLELSQAIVAGGDPADPTTLSTWEMNTKYNYTVLFDLEKIYFAPTVASEWANVTADTLLQ